MTKKIKLNIKNKQLANALDLGKLKKNLEAKKESKKTPAKKAPAKKSTPSSANVKVQPEVEAEAPKPRKIRARTKSAFTEENIEATKQVVLTPVESPTISEEVVEHPPEIAEPVVKEEKKEVFEKLGPTGRHIKDLLPQDKKKPSAPPKEKAKEKTGDQKTAPKKPLKDTRAHPPREVKAAKRFVTPPSFDSRDRQGLRVGEEQHRRHRKKRAKGSKRVTEDTTIRPTNLKVRLPISIKDLASEMKLKASELISKLFMQGMAMTINDALDDETTIQLLGHELKCEIEIDTSEEERIKITDQSIRDEIKNLAPEDLQARAPVVTFMGHVDHGKTSLIDKIRKSNRVDSEAGEITQHIGAFKTHTAIGDIAILDTPGHEAFSAMRARGTNVTDIVVLVIAGDEGMRDQTLEAVQHAKNAGVTIVVALNKCDKPGFNQEDIYRQLAEHDLLPEAWGGKTITVNCSAVTGEGIKELLEMLALQAEVLELRASSKSRARGTVLESQVHKGMGAVTTILVQNGTLRKGDALVFEKDWGKVKTMKNEFGHNLTEAPPSTPVAITGLSDLPEAGQEFIVVPNEKEAKEIAEVRKAEFHAQKQTRKPSLETLLAHRAESIDKKILTLILRADVQGSLEALKDALAKSPSDKVDLNIIFTGVGEISESDVQLGAASNAIIIGFHTQIESHANELAKQLGVSIHMHEIIYHAIDDVIALMTGTLDKLAQEEERGKAEVRATFKSSQHGVIVGCIVSEGTIHRNYHMRVKRNDEVIWTGKISSIRRVKDDVREVQKGVECGILLDGFNEAQEGDQLEAFEVIYVAQEL